MKKAIFFDIDGTLIDCINGITDIRPNVKKAIRNLQSQGHYVFIATGRPYAFIYDNLLDFGFDGLILANGAQVIINGKTIYKHPIDKNLIKDLIQDFHKYDIEYILQSSLYSYLNDDFNDLKEYYTHYNIPTKHILNDYSYNDDLDVYKMEILYKTDKAKEFCHSLENDDFDLMTYDDFPVCEIYSKNNSKASGILKALEYLDIDIEDSYAFGDGRNDIEMLSTVGCGIAMGNASDSVKIHAKEITDSVLDDGIASGIEKFILS
ncbi:MAG: HAD family hydrolase [Clostridium sp.]|nr:HAD family hydrolase [Clostridium sp.]